MNRPASQDKQGLVLVKLGGSLITDKSKPFTERREVIQRLAREIHDARQQKGIRLLVGHGGGSFPHKPAIDYATHKGVTCRESYKGIALVQDAAARLNRIVTGALISAGEDAVSVQPSAASLARNCRISEWDTRPIEKLLEFGMLPVVYGDVCFDISQGCCILSTEEIFRFLNARLGGTRIIMCGKTGGVFTSDPGRDPDARHIPLITKENFDSVRGHLMKSDGIDVTGGMVHKIELALELASAGSEVQIIDGTFQGNLLKALLGDHTLGTVIR